MKIKAILFGATGMVGEGVLLEALKHEDVESVLAISRRSYDVKHEKFSEILHTDFFNYSSLEDRLKGYNACFFCLGVSSVGMSEREYTRITHDLTMQAATTLSKLDPEMTFCFVSGTGTDSTEKGRTMWARVKGQTENDLARLPFKAVYLFRPGLIKPAESQKNIKSIYKLAKILYPLFRVLSPKYACTMEDLGLAMIHAVTTGYSTRILENRDIALLAGGGSSIKS
jgi:uncharacterized protein YbjT (DUF2867 family)